METTLLGQKPMTVGSFWRQALSAFIYLAIKECGEQIQVYDIAGTASKALYRYGLVLLFW
jgi:hypothetical protein